MISWYTFHVLNHFFIKYDFIKWLHCSKDPGYIQPNTGGSARDVGAVVRALSLSIACCVYSSNDILKETMLNTKNSAQP